MAPKRKAKLTMKEKLLAKAEKMRLYRLKIRDDPIYKAKNVARSQVSYC